MEGGATIRRRSTEYERGPYNDGPRGKNTQLEAKGSAAPKPQLAATAITLPILPKMTLMLSETGGRSAPAGTESV